ncbi:hypothetical protein [Vulcanisaeta sp. JCM 16159]|uniref:hypothetical protein n=1 Tax=Vulcanisaeta sp. JCM 16159 TaxID=1295371 RepID=UPI0006D0F2B2|nr:hypothetical protein [Vulcanisaeta sp. JCM 16159]
MIEGGGLRFMGVIKPSIDDVAEALAIRLRARRSRFRYISWNLTLMKYALMIGGKVSGSISRVLDDRKFYVIWSKKPM